VEPLTTKSFSKGQYRAKPIAMSERVTAIPQGSRVQENSKRRISLMDNDMAWSSWKHEEQCCESNIAQRKRFKVHLSCVASKYLAQLKLSLIEVEALKRVTLQKAKAAVND
jgi:hypothetical protein